MLSLGAGKSAKWSFADRMLMSPRKNHLAMHWKGTIFIVGGCNLANRPIEYMETFAVFKPNNVHARVTLKGPSYSSLLCKLTSVVPFEGALYTTGEFQF